MTIEEKSKIENLIRSVEDFPEKGVIFRDITTALKDKEGLEIIIKDFTDRYKDKGIDYVVGADARGFFTYGMQSVATHTGFNALNSRSISGNFDFHPFRFFK